MVVSVIKSRGARISIF